MSHVINIILWRKVTCIRNAGRKEHSYWLKVLGEELCVDFRQGRMYGVCLKISTLYYLKWYLCIHSIYIKVVLYKRILQWIIVHKIMYCEKAYIKRKIYNNRYSLECAINISLEKDHFFILVLYIIWTCIKLYFPSVTHPKAPILIHQILTFIC